ncbi:MAG: LruC domain-containing protein [Byssovorax sp.]
MFEDQWPGHGDLDFNDAVVDYQYALAYNSSGNLVQLVATYNVLAAGSGHDNGFALQLPIPRANVGSVTLQLGNGAPSALVPRAAESNLVVDVLPSVKAAFALANDGRQINTDPTAAVLPGATYRLVVTLSTPTALSSANAPFDAFFYWAQEPTHEIHRPGYAGTSNMNAGLFGTLQDGSNGARHFVDDRGIPYVLDVPQAIKWSPESVDISAGYSQLAAFGASGGVSNQTWYQSPTNASLFTSGQGGAQPPSASFIGGADATFSVDGTCNLCVANNVSCPAAPDQCHDQGTCAPATGVCSAAPAKANGTACDDGNAGTINDVCTNGVCAGMAGSDGTSAGAAGSSCAALHASFPAYANGVYWIDPDGIGSGNAAFQVYCDMGNGGWMLAAAPSVSYDIFGEPAGLLNPSVGASRNASLWSASSTVPFTQLKVTDAWPSPSNQSTATFSPQKSMSSLMAQFPSYTTSPVATNNVSSTIGAACFVVRAKSAEVGPWSDSADWMFMGFHSLCSQPMTYGDGWDVSGWNTSWCIGCNDNNSDPQLSTDHGIGRMNAQSHWHASNTNTVTIVWLK